MGNKKALFAVGTTALTALGTFVACGSDKAKPDAAVVHDSPVQHDAPADAAPDASPYDFTCFGMANPTTAADPITIAGTTETLSMSGVQQVGSADVAIYKSGSANPVDTQTSGSDGSFASGNIATGGTPFDGYVKASAATYRTTYLYAPTPPVASLTGVPVALLASSTFATIASFASVTQDDANNGALFLTVTDCANMPIANATLSVQQGGSDVGTAFDLGALASQAQGVFVVFNVPDGATDIKASLGSMMFPPRSVLAHKKPNGANTVGTVTVTAVRPGP